MFNKNIESFKADANKYDGGVREKEVRLIMFL